MKHYKGTIQGFGAHHSRALTEDRMKEYNEMCAEFLYSDRDHCVCVNRDESLGISFPPEEGFEWPTSINSYNPHDDLNQSADVMDKIILEADEDAPRGFMFTSMTQTGFKQAIRDFISEALKQSSGGRDEE